MTRLLLVRHGQSTWNADGRWQGQADPPLSDLGRLQATHAAAAIGAVDAIVSSTLDRAATTAAILAAELGVGPVQHHAGLIERDAGEWSGLTRVEIESRYPGDLDAGRRPAGWEDDESLLGRVLPVLDRIAATHTGGDVVVVTHGGVIYRLEAHLGADHARIANLGGRFVTAEGDRWRLGDRIELLAGVELTVPDQI